MKEPEIDPTITHCWECGQLEPDHSSRNCNGRKICLKCGATEHKFYNCTIPKDSRHMTEIQKAARYCAACRKHTDHTSLDHKQCPIKREIIRERARIAREKRLKENLSVKRDTDLINATLNMASYRDWPELQTSNKQHTKIVTLITLALLDEACEPGTFDKNLEDGLKNNELPTLNYKLGPHTATKFFESITGTNVTTDKQNDARIETQEPEQNRPKVKTKINKTEVERNIQKNSSKYYRDQSGGKKQGVWSLPSETEADQIRSDRDSKRNRELYMRLKNKLDKNKLIVKINTSWSEGLPRTKRQTCNIKQLQNMMTTFDIENDIDWVTDIKNTLQEMYNLGYERDEITFDYKLLYKDDSSKTKVEAAANTRILCEVPETEANRNDLVNRLLYEDSSEDEDRPKANLTVTNTSTLRADTEEQRNELVNRLLYEDSSDDSFIDLSDLESIEGYIYKSPTKSNSEDSMLGHSNLETPKAYIFNDLTKSLTKSETGISKLFLKECMICEELLPECDLPKHHRRCRRLN